MGADVFMVNKKERTRLVIIHQRLSRQIQAQVAAKQLGLSERLFRRVMADYRQDGEQSIIHKGRGKPSNRKIDSDIQQRAIAIVRQHYSDFAPTFSHEKLTEEHGFTFSVETLRQWMIREGLWSAKSKKHKRVHQPRED